MSNPSSKKHMMTDRFKAATATATAIGDKNMSAVVVADDHYTSAEIKAAIEEDVVKARRAREVRLQQYLTMDSTNKSHNNSASTSSSSSLPAYNTRDLDLNIVNGPEFSRCKSPVMQEFDKDQFDFQSLLLQILDLNSEDKFQALNESYYDCVLRKRMNKNETKQQKLNIFRPLLEKPALYRFQSVFDKFVRTFIVKDVVAMYPDCSDVIYYQSFPCIRMVRPGEFSIGIHCDASYGFSIANINYYLPLTAIGGTNSLIIESSPGKEDWHALKMNYGEIFRFYGALCLHFTPENTTEKTRISFDFRVIPGKLWVENHDQYTSTPGYYACCRRRSAAKDARGKDCGGANDGGGGVKDTYNSDSYYSNYDRPQTAVEERDEEEEWVRTHELIAPDSRVGFPFI